MNVMYAGGQCCSNLAYDHDPCVILHTHRHQEHCKHICGPTQQLCQRAAARTNHEALSILGSFIPPHTLLFL